MEKTKKEELIQKILFEVFKMKGWGYRNWEHFDKRIPDTNKHDGTPCKDEMFEDILTLENFKKVIGVTIDKMESGNFDVSTGD